MRQFERILLICASVVLTILPAKTQETVSPCNTEALISGIRAAREFVPLSVTDVADVPLYMEVAHIADGLGQSRSENLIGTYYAPDTPQSLRARASRLEADESARQETVKRRRALVATFNQVYAQCVQ